MALMTYSDQLNVTLRLLSKSCQLRKAWSQLAAADLIDLRGQASAKRQAAPVPRVSRLRLAQRSHVYFGADTCVIEPHSRPDRLSTHAAV